MRCNILYKSAQYVIVQSAGWPSGLRRLLSKPLTRVRASEDTVVLLVSNITAVILLMSNITAVILLLTNMIAVILVTIIF